MLNQVDGEYVTSNDYCDSGNYESGRTAKQPPTHDAKHDEDWSNHADEVLNRRYEI